MFDLKLFLAIPREASFEAALTANSTLLALLTSGGDYLSAFTHKEQAYLGKPLPSSSTIEQIERARAHLESLLKRLAPAHTFTPQLLTLHG